MHEFLEVSQRYALRECLLFVSYCTENSRYVIQLTTEDVARKYPVMAALPNIGVEKRRAVLSNIGVVLGGYEGYAHRPLFGVGVPYPHFLRDVTRKITTQIQAFSTEQDTNCQIGASARRLLLHARASAAAGILLLLPPPTAQ